MLEPDEPPKSGYAGAYYPGVSDLASASPLQLTAGEHSEANLTLNEVPVYAISGTVSGYAPNQGVAIQVFDQSGVQVDEGIQFSPENGRFDMRPMAAGNYVIKAFSSQGANQTVRAEARFTLTADLHNLHLALTPAPSIPVVVQLESVAQRPKNAAAFKRPAAAGPPLSLRLAGTEPGAREAYASFESPDNSRTLSFRNVEAGRYTAIIDARESWYVASAEYGQTDLLTDDLVLTPGAPPQPMNIVLRNDSASITGTVHAGDAFTGIATIVAVPERLAKASCGIAYLVPSERQKHRACRVRARWTCSRRLPRLCVRSGRRSRIHQPGRSAKLFLAGRTRFPFSERAGQGDAGTDTHRRGGQLIARLLCVGMLSLATFAQVAPPAKSAGDFRMAGIVVDAITNQPLSGVKVSIYVSEDPEISHHTNTGADGRFAFTGLPAGKYTLIGSALGYRAQGPHQRGDYFIGVAVGPNLDSENIVFHLVRDARIEGTVTDDDGEPVRNSNVALYQRTHDVGRQQTAQVSNSVTDDRGHYWFSHLAPGTYFVAVSARPWYAQYPNPGEPAPDADSAARIAEERAPLEVAYPMTFFPSAEESSGATPIVLHPGDRVTADIAMRAVPAVHLRVRTGNARGQKSGGGVGFPRVSQRIFEGTLVPVMSSQGYTASSGVYEYTGIAPGHYVIEMPDASGKGRVGWYKEMDLSGTVELDAAENPPLASVTGVLSIEGAGRLSGKVYVVLANRSSTETFAAEVTPKGTFDFSEMEVRPGTYDVLLNVAQGFQLRAMQARGARVNGQTLLISGGSVQLALAATRELSHITGMVVHDDKAYAGAMVLLVPANAAGNLTLFRRDQSDSDGTFNLREVLPGSYTAIALENGWDLDWANPATLQPYLKGGTPVEVSGTSKVGIKVQLQR